MLAIPLPQHRGVGTSHVVGSHHVEIHVLCIASVNARSINRGQQKCQPEAVERMAYTIPPLSEVEGRQQSRTLFVALHVGAGVRLWTQTTLGILGSMWSLLLPDAAGDGRN